MTLGLIAGLIAFSASVDVRGDSACPTPSAVAGELRALLAPEQASAPEYRAFVSTLPDSVHVDFLRPDGSRLAERDLPATGACAERAKAAAAVIATWAGIFERAAPPDALPAPPVPATNVVTTAAVPALAAPAPSFWLGVGLLASWAGPDSDWAPSAEIALRYSGGSRLGWRASLTGTTPHAEVVSPARAATWSRLGLAIGPSLAWPVGASQLEVHVEAAASVLRVQGSGFLNNLSANGAALGGATGIRLAFPSVSGTPWLGIDGFYWAGDQRTVVSSSLAERSLPRSELLAGAGIGLGHLQ